MDLFVPNFHRIINSHDGRGELVDTASITLTWLKNIGQQVRISDRQMEFESRVRQSRCMDIFQPFPLDINVISPWGKIITFRYCRPRI